MICTNILVVETSCNHKKKYVHCNLENILIHKSKYIQLLSELTEIFKEKGTLIV